jgi:hypothetical protein
MGLVRVCGCCCPLVLLGIVGATAGMAALGIRVARAVHTRTMPSV